jgi:hypothetical protein
VGAAFAVPVWLVALVLAGAAPTLVGAIHTALVARVRRRTLALIATAQAGERDVPRSDGEGRGA